MPKTTISIKYKGGPGSGHRGHGGRPGKRGGSSPGSGGIGMGSARGRSILAWLQAARGKIKISKPAANATGGTGTPATIRDTANALAEGFGDHGFANKVATLIRTSGMTPYGSDTKGILEGMGYSFTGRRRLGGGSTRRFIWEKEGSPDIHLRQSGKKPMTIQLVNEGGIVSFS